MKQILTYIAFPLILFVTSLPAAEHLIRPGDSPQEVLEMSAPGDRLVFLPGVHEHGLGKHRSILALRENCWCRLGNLPPVGV